MYEFHIRDVTFEITDDRLIFGFRKAEASIKEKKEISIGPITNLDFANSVPFERINFAANWALELDSYLKEQFLKNSQVLIRIPLAHPAIVAPKENQDASSYWSLRQNAGALIRPLFLKPPELSLLFQYQKEGVEWLVHRQGAILADEMGLGKTVQLISATRLLINNGLIKQALILCPKSLLTNWEHELYRWAPELSQVRVFASKKDRRAVLQAISKRVHLLLFNYEQVRELQDHLGKHHYELIIADEAHRLRKMTAQVTRAIRKIQAKRFWIATGTPVEKSAEDLAVLLSLIAPKRFAPSDGQLELSILRVRSKNYVLRRRRENVLTQLPPVLESVEYLDLSAKQRAAYNATRFRKSKYELDLLVINQLRSICDYDPFSDESSKADRILEILEDILVLKEKVIVFSYLLEPLNILKSRLRLRKIPALLLQGSASLEERARILEQFSTSNDHSILLASSRVASEGLTLTSANHVIFFNEWWNPSSNRQARDRVVRIGQKRPVRIYKFVCRATVEEALQRILEEKGELYEKLIEKIAQPSTQLSQSTYALIRRKIKEVEAGLLVTQQD